jgi:hypothetical protein
MIIKTIVMTTKAIVHAPVLKKRVVRKKLKIRNPNHVAALTMTLVLTIKPNF